MAMLVVLVDMNATLPENGSKNGKVMNDIIDSIETIASLTDASMVWGAPRGKVGCFELTFKNERQEDCAFSMLSDLALDFPMNVTLEEVE